MYMELQAAAEELDKNGYFQAASVLRKYTQVRWSAGGYIGNVGRPEDDRSSDGRALKGGGPVSKVRPD